MKNTTFQKFGGSLKARWQQELQEQEDRRSRAVRSAEAQRDSQRVPGVNKGHNSCGVSPFGKEYAARNRILRDMGFASYADYLKSDLWKEIRLKVLERADFTCHICQGDASQVHHRLYFREVLEGKWLNCMNAICVECHKLGEFSDDGEKVGLKDANKRLTYFRKPKPGQCIHCKKNITRVGRSLCRKCKRELLSVPAKEG